MKVTIILSIFALLIVTLGACSNAPAGESAPTMIVISSTDLKAMAKEKENLTIVDVRQASDFGEGHIEGATNIPYQLAIDTIAKEYSKTDKIILVCYRGVSSKRVASSLVGKEFTNIYNLKGGMDGWDGELTK
ncbi:MAG: rhodanese-like domain-containing protein [Deltaproteobacteria bacterium]|nr:rhodanese-like domain-containing protein [Deltaproteobacteria bacterium]